MREVGYHGTTKDKAEKIFAEQYFKPSTKDIEWLGHGVYFFVYKEHAETWAYRETQKPKNIGKTAAVLKAELEYKKEQLLDLDNPQDLKNFQKFLKNTYTRISKYRNIETAVYRNPQDKQNAHRCAAINVLRKMDPEMAVVKQTFVHKTRYSFLQASETQICVCDPKIIVSISIDTCA